MIGHLPRLSVRLWAWPERDKGRHVSAHMATMWTRQVGDRPASNRIGLLDGRRCLGKGDRFATTGAIDDEVPFSGLSDAGHRNLPHATKPKVDMRLRAER
jgi:hypothetical protein